MSDALALPDDLHACQTLVEQLVITVAEQQQQIATLEDKHLAQQLEIAHLIKLAFGRRSERYLEDPNQLKLDLGSGDEAHDAAEGLHDAKQEQAAADELIIAEHIRRKQAKAEKPRDEKLPAHLLRYEVEAEATDEQQHCETHGPREIIGHDRVETLEYVRPQLKVRVTIYPKFACPQAPECGVTSPERAVGLVEGNRYDTSRPLASMPAVPEPRSSRASTAITCRSIASKIGSPAADQPPVGARTPSRSTLLNIMMHAALLISPLIKYFADCVREDTAIGTDDTGVTLLLPKDVPPIDPDDSRSQRIHEVLTAARQKGAPSANAKMWAYRGVNVRLNVFDFTVSPGTDAQQLVARWSGRVLDRQRLHRHDHGGLLFGLSRDHAAQ